MGKEDAQVMEHEVADVRAFGRFYTRQIGLLEEHFNHSPFSLPEGRVLYEIARNGRTTSADIARALTMDPGYVSRILQKLIGGGFVAATPSATDRRANTLALTRQGETAFAQLDAASNEAVGELLRPVEPTRRQAMLAAMRTIRTALGDSMQAAPLILRPHRIGELGWLVHRQGVIYNEQYGWDIGFEALISRIYYEYEAAPDTPPKNLWVAERNGAVIGSAFVMPSEGIEGSAQLRMLYVEPEAQGLGIGGILVGQCVSFARDSGYERMRLWTHAIQKAARKLYAAAGFSIVEEWDHRSFGQDLHAETWELRF